jgi:hypothetical protein
VAGAGVILLPRGAFSTTKQCSLNFDITIFELEDLTKLLYCRVAMPEKMETVVKHRACDECSQDLQILT